VTAGQQRPDRVAQGHSDDGEGGEQLPVRLRSYEQCDSDEADDEAEEADAHDARLTEEAEGEQSVEDRHRSLNDRGEPRVDPLLAPGEEPERHRRVHEAHDDEPTPGPAELRQR
jgi:hypothetical protein